MSNEENIKASILLVLLKCIVVGYFNGNESFTGRLFSNYKLQAFEYAIPFFPISHLWCFLRDFCRNVYEETILFQPKFQKAISKCSMLRKIRMSNFVILKWRPFEYKVKVENFVHFWGCFFINEKRWHF